MESSRFRNKALFILLFLSVGFYFFLIMPKIAKPIVGWEICTWKTAQSIATHGAASVNFFYLPPFYASLLALSFKLFGISEISARIIGIVCFIAIAVIMCFLVKEISGNKKETLLAQGIALIIFVSSPAAVQGSLVIDHPDTTLFMLMACLFYLVLFKTERAAFGLRVFWLGCLYALCLWAKMTTALAFLAALPLVFVVSGERKKALTLSLSVFLFGITLFILSWFLYCYFLVGARRFIEPFSYYAMNTAESLFVGIPEKAARIILDIFRISVWFSPFLLVLAFVIILNILKDHTREENKKIVHLAVFSCIVMAGYITTNATFSSFPKYVVPVVPMLSCVIACYSQRLWSGFFTRRVYFFSILFLIGGILYYFFFSGDMVYEIFLMRQGQLFNTLEVFWHRILVKEAIFFAFPAFFVFLSFKFLSVPLNKRIMVGVLGSLIAGNIAISLTQRKSEYSLNYAYGTAGIEQVKKFLKEKAPLEVFTTTEGIIANIDGIRFSGIGGTAWNTPELFLDFMNGRKPHALIYGLATNTIPQLKRILYSPEVKAYFAQHYKEYVLGSYSLLIRNVHDNIL